jgi:hypothetical protein
MTGTVSIAIYSDRTPPKTVERSVAATEAAGLTVESDQPTEVTVGENDYFEFTADYANSSVRLSFNLSDNRPPDEPVLSLGGLSDTVHPKWARADTDTNYKEWMEIVFELVCRLATQLQADYVAWLNTADDPMKSVPQDRPIGEAVEQPPVFGIYTTQVLENLGGVSSLFNTEPWYIGDIDGDRTAVIESEQPWVESGWQPPTDTIVKHAEFRDDPERP